MQIHSGRAAPVRLALFAGLWACGGAAFGATTCDQFGSIQAVNGTYIVQNNFFNPNGGQMCIDVDTGTGAFSVRNTNSVATNGGPSGYPSIFKGCHWGNCSSNSGLPLKLSSIGTAPSAWSVTPPNAGSYDIAYDIWFNQSPTTSGQPDGTEIMIWLNHAGGVQPAGQRVGTTTINGAAWDVWVAPRGSAGFNNIWNIVSYVAVNPVSSVDFDLKPFFNDSVARGQLSNDWYLIDVEAGFELWSDGNGVRSNSFNVGFNTGSGGGGGGGGGSGGIDPSAWYSLVSAGSGACVEDQGGGTYNGVAVSQNGCSAASDSQQWQFQPTDSGFYKIVSRHAPWMALDSGGSWNGAKQQLWSYGGGANQQWKAEAQSNGQYRLIGRESGRCLDVPAGQTGPVQLQIWDCWGGANQSFQLVRR
jgi:hypothetical protein